MLQVFIITKAANQDYGKLILLKFSSKPVHIAKGLWAEKSTIACQ